MFINDTANERNNMWMTIIMRKYTEGGVGGFSGK